MSRLWRRRAMVLIMVSLMLFWLLPVLRFVTEGVYLPGILRGDLTSPGGTWDACSAIGTPNVGQILGDASSPELNARLKDMFPAGTPEDRLIAFLLQQGFHMGGSCGDNNLIHQADLQIDRPGIILSLHMKSAIFWGIDAGGLIQWEKGYLREDSL